MFIELTPEQRQLQAEMRQYFANLISPEERAEMEVDRHGKAYRAIIKRMGSDGKLGVGWPKEFGGHGFGLVGVFVGVRVGVLVGVFVGVLVGVRVGVFVGVLVGVFVGVEVGGVPVWGWPGGGTRLGPRAEGRRGGAPQSRAQGPHPGGPGGGGRAGVA